MTRWVAIILATVLMGVSMSANAQVSDESVLGRYRLVNVMETAAALELRADHRFSWALTVGGLDLEKQGEWQRRENLLWLKVDGADEIIAKVIRLNHVGPVDRVLGGLPAGHPLHAYGEGYVVRLFSTDGAPGAAHIAFAVLDNGKMLEWGDDYFGSGAENEYDSPERWQMARAIQGRKLAGLMVISDSLRRQFKLELAPGEMADIHIDETAIERDEDRVLMMQFEIDANGHLIPDGAQVSQPDARYVRD